MAFGEIIVEAFSRLILEFLFYGTAYWTGYAVVIIATLGAVQPEPLIKAQRRSRSKSKKNQTKWSIWLYPAIKQKVLKESVVCIIGVMAWIVAGACVYFSRR